ncbi:MAG: lysophospholipid acyltransferase family protein [Sodaliphilus sp.]
MKEKWQNVLLAPLAWMLHLLAWMPWWWIWLNADVMYFIAYRVLGYRKRIVRKNLVDSFPNLSLDEIKRIERQFYRNFVDYFFEAIKMLHISNEDMRRHMQFRDVHLVDEAIARGQSVMLYAAHTFNWEWLTSISMWFDDSTLRAKPIIGQAYHPLENAWFDRFFLHLRSRFSECFPSSEVLRTMMGAKREGRLMVLGFLSDQHPLPGHKGVITRFLNHPTDFINGTEALARKLDMTVLYFDIRKIKRGHYECVITPMFEHAKNEPKDAITLRYAEMLESFIHRDPALWMWTHNRWKRPVQYPENFQSQSK